MTLHPRDAAIKSALTATQVVAMTIWAEARAEPIEGEIAVGCVIRNRVLRPQRFGDTWQKVCLAKWQFSCWIPQGGEANYRMLMARCEAALKGDLPWPAQADWIAQGIISGAIEDRTGGSTHYYAPLAMVPRGSVPKWAKGLKPLQVGSQLFFGGVE